MAIATATTPRTSTIQISRVPYMPGLDGMRALAVLAVLIYHAKHDWMSAGFLGVEVFFVISGYLITLLLIAEHERSGMVQLGAFWARRFRRLLPALYLTLILVIVYCAFFFRDALGKLRGDVIAAMFYVSNWYQIWTGQGYAALADFVPLRHLWSLAVEEQFYLVWPLVMVLILRRGRDRLPRIGLWLIGLSFAIAIVTGVLFHSGFYNTNTGEFPSAYIEIFGRQIDKNNFLYLGTISRSTGILMGAGFAMLWRPIAVLRGPMRDRGRMLDVVALFGLIGLGVLMFTYELTGSTSGKFYAPLFRGGITLTDVLTVMVIAGVTHRATITSRWLGHPVLVWLGARSYGLYLYHWPIYQIIRKQAGIPLSLPQFALGLALTVGVAELSYRYVEMPIRRREFGQSLRRAKHILIVMGVVGGLAGYGLVSLATADVKCTNTIECDNQANAGGVVGPVDSSVSTATTAPVPDPTATTIPGASSTTAAPTTTAPKTVINGLAVGESVMKGAESQLLSNGFQVVDTKESRGPDDTLQVLQYDLANYDVQGPIVIQVGTNGPVSQEKYDAIVTAVGDRPVIMMTVKAPRDWIAPNNEIIRALPAAHPNVTVVDWEAHAPEVEAELSEGDGRIHLSTAKAKIFYTNLILEALGLPTMEG